MPCYQSVFFRGVTWANETNSIKLLVMVNQVCVLFLSDNQVLQTVPSFSIHHLM